MERGVAAALNPLSVIPGIEITDAQRAMRRRAGPIRLNVGDEADKRRIAFEDHVELTHLVTLHAVRTLRIALVPVHVTIDAFDHRARTFQIAEPVLRMSRAQRRHVLLDEGLE